MFQLFEKIINGRLQPKYISDQNLTEVSRLLKINFDVNPDEEKIITSNEYWNLCIEPYNSYEIINVSDNPDETLITIKETYHDLPALTNPQFQFPPDRKSELYQQLISREYQLITEKIKLQFNDIDNPNEAQFIADKNFNIAIRLSNELNRNNSEFGQMNYKVDLTSSNSFIIHFLNYCLFNIALHIKDIFSPIIEIKKEQFWTSGFKHFTERIEKKVENEFEEFQVSLVRGKVDKVNIIVRSKNKIEAARIEKEVEGFQIPLTQEKVEKVHAILTSENIIEAELNDFQEIFASKARKIKNPIRWLPISQKTNRGHQIKLYMFLENMFSGTLSRENRRKAVHLFVDEKGKFFNGQINRPNENDRNTHDIFKKLLKDIIN